MNRLEAFWRWLSTSRYTRQLEADNDLLREENVRLKQENRHVLNSLLAVTGHAPIEDGKPPAMVRLPPRRSRSWPQIARYLEHEAGKQMRAQEKLVMKETTNAS